MVSGRLGRSMGLVVHHVDELRKPEYGHAQIQRHSMAVTNVLDHPVKLDTAKDILVRVSLPHAYT